jgi:hypothetical protein
VRGSARVCSRERGVQLVALKKNVALLDAKQKNIRDGMRKSERKKERKKERIEKLNIGIKHK